VTRSRLSLVHYIITGTLHYQWYITLSVVHYIITGTLHYHWYITLSLTETSRLELDVKQNQPSAYFVYISVKTAVNFFVFTFSEFIENFDTAWVNRFFI
jgi:hypothetical protein